MIIGYARVSSKSQHLDAQIDALTKHGCEYIYQDKQSGFNDNRPALKKMLAKVRPCDTIVITSLDRLARSTVDLLSIVAKLKNEDVYLKSLREPWTDTSSTMGKFLLTVFAGLSEFERDLMAERMAAGKEQALKRGVKFGPREKLTGYQQRQVIKMLKDGEIIKTVARHFNVGVATIDRIKKKYADIF